MITYVEL